MMRLATCRLYVHIMKFITCHCNLELAHQANQSKAFVDPRELSYAKDKKKIGVATNGEGGEFILLIIFM